MASPTPRELPSPPVSCISSLLLPTEVGGWIPTDVAKPEMLPDVEMFGARCYHIRGQHPRGLGAQSLVIDKTSLLVRQRIKHDGEPEAISYVTCSAK